MAVQSISTPDMKAVIQRVLSAKVTIRETGDVRSINQGLVVLLGVTSTDTSHDVRYMADKIVSLRIFNDSEGLMNLAFTDLADPNMLVVSQFTLYGDTRKGRRPSFVTAAPGSIAEPIYREFVSAIEARGVAVKTGEFGADMLVDIANDGPVTLIIESPMKATDAPNGQ